MKEKQQKKNIGVRSIRFAMVDNKLARCILCNVPKSIYCERILWESIACFYSKKWEEVEPVFSIDKIFNDDKPSNRLYEEVLSVCRALVGCRLEEHKLVNGAIKSITIIPCFSKISIDKEDKAIRVKINDEMRPYITALKEQFLKIPVDIFGLLDSMYSQRLYRTLRTHIKRGTAKYNLETICDFLGAPDYARTGVNFSKHILKPAIKEINRKTDIYISATPVKDGKTITGYSFGIVDVDIIDRRQKQDKERRIKYAELNEKMKNNPDPDPVPAIYDFDTIGL